MNSVLNFLKGWRPGATYSCAKGAVLNLMSAIAAPLVLVTAAGAEEHVTPMPYAGVSEAGPLWLSDA